MTEKHARDMTDAEFAEALGQVERDDEARNRERLGLPPRGQGAKWTPEQIQATQERAAAAEAERRKGPQLPEHLAGKDARSLSPVEHDEAARVLGLPRLNTFELLAQQERWERSHGRG